jgi:acyl carrier protein
LDLRIVNPGSLTECAGDEIGEIWVAGPSVAKGYWGRSTESEETFGAQLSSSPSRRYLRTGDLGFFSDGELFIAGRLKELIIIRGQNHYPQDIEQTVAQSHEGLVTRSGAAFSVESDSQERLVIVHELKRDFQGDVHNIIHQIRVALALNHELDAHAIALILQASLPRTSSGKVQRRQCRQRYLSRDLRVLHHWERVSHRKIQLPPLTTTGTRTPQSIIQFTERIEAAIAEWISEESEIRREQFQSNVPFAEMGLDSLSAVELSHVLEEWLQIELTPIVVWNYPTPAALARYLAGRIVSPPAETPPPNRTVRTFDDLLTSIEQMDEQEVQRSIATKHNENG